MPSRFPVISEQAAASQVATLQAAGRFSPEDKRRLFKGLVVAELEAGFLRYSRREALMAYAAKLGLGEFEACLLMAEAQYQEYEIEPVRLDSAASLDNLTRPESWSIPLRLGFALAAAIFVDLLLINWLFG